MTNPTVEMNTPADAFAEMDRAVGRRRYMVAAAVVTVLAVIGVVVGVAMGSGANDAQTVDTDDATQTDDSDDTGEAGTDDSDDTGEAGTEDSDDTGEVGTDNHDDTDATDPKGSTGNTEDTADGEDGGEGEDTGAGPAPQPQPDPTPAPDPDPEPTPVPEPEAAAPAELSVPGQVYLEGPAYAATFDVTNVGDEDLDFSFANIHPEVQLAGDWATPLAGGQSRSFDIAVDLTGYPAGEWALSFDVNSNGGNATIDVTGDKVGVLVPLGPYLEGPAVLDFGIGNQATLTVENIGSETAEVGPLQPLPWNPVTILGTPASIEPGDTYEFTVEVDTSDFGFGAWAEDINMPYNGGTLHVDLVGTNEVIVVVPIDFAVEPAPVVVAIAESGAAFIPVGNAEGGPVTVDVTYPAGVWGPASYLVPEGGGGFAVSFAPMNLAPGQVVPKFITVEWLGGSADVLLQLTGT